MYSTTTSRLSQIGNSHDIAHMHTIGYAACTVSFTLLIPCRPILSGYWQVAICGIRALYVVGNYVFASAYCLVSPATGSKQYPTCWLQINCDQLLAVFSEMWIATPLITAPQHVTQRSMGSRPCADAAVLAYLPLCSQCDNPRRRRHEVQYVQAVWESVMVQRRAQSYRHGGIGDHVTALMNNAMRNEKLLGVAKMRGLYQGTAAWDVPYTVVYIDFDVQYHVKLTRRLDDNMIYTFSRVNWRNTLAIVCCSKHIDSHIHQQSSCCSLISDAPLVRNGRNGADTTYIPDHPMVRAVVIMWVLYCFIFIIHTSDSTYQIYGSR